MPDELTVSELLTAAGAQLRSSFEYHRSTAFHEGEKGAEVEVILRTFLDDHLPRRFASSSAHMIDADNARSKQCDVVIYDSLSSPIYRTSSESIVLPVDHVAAVIEVKTSLNKAELADAYEKVASCKRLKKSKQTEMDRAPTGSSLTTVTTMGIVFAFASDTSLSTLAENARDLNANYDSKLWPDVIVVLDKGVITYAFHLIGQQSMGFASMRADDNFVVPPAYQVLAVIEDGALTLNRFFVMLLSHLTFFSYRPSALPFAQALAGAPKTLTTIQSYQFDTGRELHPVGPHDDTEPTIDYRITADGKVVGQLAFIPWQDGAILAVGSTFPFAPILGALLGTTEPTLLIPSAGLQYSSVLKLSESEFRSWPDKLAKMTASPVLALVEAATVAETTEQNHQT
jgi:hypothetical protein